MTTETSTETSTAQANTASGEGQAQDQGGQDQATAQPQGQDQATTTTTDAEKGKGATPEQGAQEQPKPDQKAETAPEQKPAEKPADYALTLPEGTKADALTKWFENHAKTAGLSKEQAQGVYDGWIALNQEAIAADTKAREEAGNLLKKEWQKDYDANLLLIAKTVEQLGGKELVAEINKAGLGNSPAMLRAWHRVGKLLSEDTFANGSGGNAGQGGNPAQKMYPNQGK